jgi:hypothetical protein
LGKTQFDPGISTPGVKIAVNIVNNQKSTPAFPLQAWKLVNE